MKNTGKLFLIPNLLGETPPLESIPLSVKQTVEHIHHFVFETEKAGRAFIKKMAPSKNQGDLNVQLCNKFTPDESLKTLLTPCLNGDDLGLISDAGCPAVADPGAALVRCAHQNGIQVVPLVGPSSILLALMASGLNGQSFAFHGYLSIDPQSKKKDIQQLEKNSKEKQQTQIFMETPYRNSKMLEDLLKWLKPETQLCVAAALTTAQEYVKTQPVYAWKKTRIDLHKKPVIFALLAT